MLWIGLVLLAAGVAMFGVGRSRMMVRNAKGNFAQNTSGNFTMTYTENAGAVPASDAPSSEQRFLNWGGLAIAAAGLVVSIIGLWKP